MFIPFLEDSCLELKGAQNLYPNGFLKGWVYVYVQLIYFAVHLKLTQHCKSTILQIFKKLNK